jgi:hypothetical protein
LGFVFYAQFQIAEESKEIRGWGEPKGKARCEDTGPFDL